MRRLEVGSESKPSTGRVLLVDDHPVIAEAVEAIFGWSGPFRVVARALDGFQALHAARQSNPHLVIMDVKMAGLDGPSATKLLLNRSRSTGLLAASL